MGAKKEEQLSVIKELRVKAKEPGARPEIAVNVSELESDLEKFELSDKVKEEKARLLGEGFPDWNKKDFKQFCSSMERHGRYDIVSIIRDMINECGKEEQDVKRYFVAFWTHYRRIAEWRKVIGRIEKGENKILRLRQIRDAIQEKVERHLEDTFGPYYWDVKEGADRLKDLRSATELLHHSWQQMRISYGSVGKGRTYQEEEDAFLLCMMHRHGFGAAERIRLEIRRAWQFRFNWYFKSRTAQEIQKRCDLLVKIVERENEEVRKKEREAEVAEEAKDEDSKSPTVEQAPVASFPATPPRAPMGATA